jgi:protein TonB
MPSLDTETIRRVVWLSTALLLSGCHKAPVAHGTKPSSEDAASTGPYRVSAGVIAPVAIQRVEPDFSKCVGKLAGNAPLVEATIRADGTVHDIKIRRSAGRCVDDALVAALQKSRFRPGTLDGRPVDVLYQVTASINYR